MITVWRKESKPYFFFLKIKEGNECWEPQLEVTYKWKKIVWTLTPVGYSSAVSAQLWARICFMDFWPHIFWSQMIEIDVKRRVPPWIRLRRPARCLMFPFLVAFEKICATFQPGAPMQWHQLQPEQVRAVFSPLLVTCLSWVRGVPLQQQTTGAKEESY